MRPEDNYFVKKTTTKTGQWNPFHQLKILSCNIAGGLLTNMVFGSIVTQFI